VPGPNNCKHFINCIRSAERFFLLKGDASFFFCLACFSWAFPLQLQCCDPILVGFALLSFPFCGLVTSMVSIDAPSSDVLAVLQPCERSSAFFSCRYDVHLFPHFPRPPSPKSWVSLSNCCSTAPRTYLSYTLFLGDLSAPVFLLTSEQPFDSSRDPHKGVQIIYVPSLLNIRPDRVTNFALQIRCGCRALPFFLPPLVPENPRSHPALLFRLCVLLFSDIFPPLGRLTSFGPDPTGLRTYARRLS